MSFIKNKDVNKDGKENKDKAGGLAVLPQSHFSHNHSFLYHQNYSPLYFF